MIPPHDLDAERSVLGTLLMTDRATFAVRQDEGLTEADFYSKRHALVFRAICALDDADGTCDRVSVAAWLDQNGLLHDAGGRAGLDDLGGPITAAGNVRQYARSVREYGLMRGILRVAAEATQAVHERNGKAKDILGSLTSAGLDLADGGRSTGALVGEVAGQVIEEVAARTSYQEVTGIPTGFHMLDAKTGGLQPPKVYVCGARPKMGKSAFVTQIGGFAAARRHSVAMFSLEMGRDEIAERLIGMSSGLAPTRMARGGLDQRDTRKMLDAGQRISDLPLWIDDTAHLSVDDIRARCRRIRQRMGLELVIVDYLQLMHHPRSNGMTTNDAVAATSRGLKLLAKELHVPVIVLSQLNRDLEKRGASAEAKKPQPSDFRDSGAIEQDADVLMAMWREEVYDPECDRKGLTDVAILAQRRGPTADYGEIVLPWHGPTMKFGRGEKPPPEYLRMA